MCLLERRIIYPTFNFTKLVSYSQIIMNVVQYNACTSGIRKIPGLVVGCSSGTCWDTETKLQVSYDNLMEWVYTICEKIGGTANIRLSKTNNEQYEMIFELSQGTDRSILQEVNPHIIFSDRYNNLLSLKLSITLDTLIARILKLSSDSQSRIEPAPFYSWWNTTDCRADSTVAPVAHKISPDHRF